ncbi:restriction endonuclease subunit S [Aliiglaciecola sp. LCG003]|uniref:restriction endonuclease subunit S n=1 Tax=Aliiglaciecola sp. LCG003 TaxID=3053655 RepID=UPI002572C490|nr:restriction endonuclease subunit S [Aliiglaciecola sp. LCG003]WJG07725.1 restriction endonuclease subunit S [Aliiglaciecola sp. LCG003]
MGYEITNLGEYINVQGGYAFKSKDFSKDGNPVLKIKNVRFGHIDFTDCGFVSDSVINGLERFKTNAGDILISMTGSGPNAPQSLVGRVAKIYQDDKAAYINQRVGRIQIKDDKVDPDFIFYLLQQKSSIDYLVANSTGSANQANINAVTICSVPCPKVTFKESVAIADILRNIDLGIRNNSQMNATLEKIAQRIFKSWFVDFDPVKANAEGVPFDGLSPEIQALFPNEFDESELGMIPKEWEVKKLEQIGDIITGKTPSTKNEEYYGNEIPFITIPDMHGKSLVTKSSKYLSKKGELSQPKKTLPKGSILVSCIATPGLVILAHENCQTNQQINSLLPYDKFSNFYFLSLKSMSGRSAFSHDGTVFDNMNKTSFSNLKMVIPSFDLLKNFNDLIEPIFEKVLINQKQVNTLAKIRDKLLPRLISGKIAIQKAEELLEEAS